MGCYLSFVNEKLPPPCFSVNSFLSVLNSISIPACSNWNLSLSNASGGKADCPVACANKPDFSLVIIIFKGICVLEYSPKYLSRSSLFNAITDFGMYYSTPLQFFVQNSGQR